MKFSKLLAFSALAVSLSFTACKNEGSAVKDEARESLATTQTTAQPTADATMATKPAAPEVPAGPLTTVSFEEDTYDFGEVMEGEKVVHVYKFTNTGKEPLVISKAKGSCGCTVPEWPREPIPAGGKGEIRVEFNSKGKGKVGGAQQSKKVTITANTDPTNTYLTIKGTVNKEAES